MHAGRHVHNVGIVKSQCDPPGQDTAHGCHWMRPRPVCGYTAMLLIWYLTTIRRYAARNTQVLYTALVSCIALKSHRKRCEIRDHDGSVDGLARLQLGPFRIAALVGEAKPGRAVCVAVRRRGLVDL